MKRANLMLRCAGRWGHPHEPEDLQESMKSAGRGTPNDLTNLHMGELRPYKEVVP